MKNSIFALSAFALVQLTVAAPVNQKRDVVWETVVEEVWETVYTTTTVWFGINGEQAVATSSAAASSVGGFYEHPQSSILYTVISSAAPEAVAYTAAPVVAAAPVVSSAPAPVVSSAVAPYVAPPAPTTTAAPVAPAPVSPAPVATTTPVAVAPAPSVYSAPALSPSAAAPASGGSTGTHTGDITYYDVSVGTGSCGTTASNTDNVVALSHLDMNNGANPNNNPLCGTMININYNGATHSARVFDTCPTCSEGSLDLTNALFLAVAPEGDGRVTGVSWSFA